MKKTFDADNETEIKLKDILGFDIKAHKLKVQNIIVSTETLEQMNKPDLQRYAAYQDELADQAKKEGRHTESSGHKVNIAMAQLLLQQMQKPEAIKQSSFDAWKAVGFSAGPEYIDLIRECKNNGSFQALAGYSGYLSDISFDLNGNLGSHMRGVNKDNEEYLKYFAQKRAVSFIYRGITKLRPEHSNRFEAAMRAGSVENMRALARGLLECGHYSDELIRNLCHDTFFSDYLAKEKTARLFMSFGEEVRLYRIEKYLKSIVEEIKATFGVEPGFAEALENMNPAAFVAAYKTFIAKGKPARKQCKKLMGAYKLLYNLLSNLELMNDGEVKRNTDIKENVLEPAFILLQAQIYLEKNYTPEFLEKLNANGFASYEDAVKESGKLRLKQDDFELYQVLRVVEKCRDYDRHANDFAYIGSDFKEIEKRARADRRSRAFRNVDIIAAEFDISKEVQRCSFDLTAKKLNCNTPELKEVLVTIYNDKESAELLTQLIRNAIDMNSLPNALHIYNAISKAYKTLDGVDYYMFAEISVGNPVWTIKGLKELT